MAKRVHIITLHQSKTLKETFEGLGQSDCAFTTDVAQAGLSETNKKLLINPNAVAAIHFDED